MAKFAFNSLLPRMLQRFEAVFCESKFRDQFVKVQTNFQDFALTAADMDTANTTPVTLLAAPGTGLVNVVTGIVTYVVAGATPFELGSGTLGYLYTDGSGAAVATAVPNATVESATTTYYYSVPLAVVPVVNAVIVAKPSADVTAGDGAVYGRIFYKTITVADLSASITDVY